MQNSRLMDFALHRWVESRKFKGASFGCAVLLNFFLLIFKVVVCGGALLLRAPHRAAHSLLNSPTRRAWNRILYFFLVLACLAVDISALMMSSAIVIGGVQCLFDEQILTGLILSAIGALTGWWSVKCAIFVFSRAPTEDEDVEEEEEQEEGEPIEEEEEIHFCQLFRIGENMSLLIDHVEMCPDETAFIRVVDDEGYTPIYKRKIRRDKLGNRFILFNGTNHYLDAQKTQPIVPKK